MITVVLPISRTTYLKPIFDCLAVLEKPPNTELLILTDGDNELEQAVNRRLDSISFKRIRVVSFGNIPAEGINDRRYRISAIHNKARHLIPSNCDYILSLEDDTTYPYDVIPRMMYTIKSQGAAYVEAVELGRWISPYIGAWKTDNVYNPNEIYSVMPSHGVQNIDAGGLYCALFDADLYKMHHFEPFDKQGKNGLSCDVNFGFYLRQQGYKCFVDHSIQCDHIGDKGSVNLGNTKPAQVIFEKHKNNWTGRYK